MWQVFQVPFRKLNVSLPSRCYDVTHSQLRESTPVLGHHDRSRKLANKLVRLANSGENLANEVWQTNLQTHSARNTHEIQAEPRCLRVEVYYVRISKKTRTQFKEQNL